MSDDNAQLPAGGELTEQKAKVAFEKLSREKPQTVTEMFAMMGAGPMANPLHNKMTPEHITQVLDLAAKHDERDYDLHKRAQEQSTSNGTSVRRYAFASFIVVAVLVAIVLFLFRDQPNVLVPVLAGVGGLVSGAVGGFGYGRSKSR